VEPVLLVSVSASQDTQELTAVNLLLVPMTVLTMVCVGMGDVHVMQDMKELIVQTQSQEVNSVG
jgi:hypothetical protein